MSDERRALDRVVASMSREDRYQFTRDLSVYGNAAALITVDGKVSYVSVNSMREEISDKDGVCPATIPLPL